MDIQDTDIHPGSQSTVNAYYKEDMVKGSGDGVQLKLILYSVIPDY